LRDVTSWDDFLHTRLDLDPAQFVDASIREELDALPSSVSLFGDRVPLHYDVERGTAVVRLRLREGKARRIRPGTVPSLDRPVRFTVLRGRSELFHAASVEELAAGLARPVRRKGPRGRRRPRR